VSKTVKSAIEDWEEWIEDSMLLQCLESAGIDNCEAYSLGYAEFAKWKNERDGEVDHEDSE